MNRCCDGKYSDLPGSNILNFSKYFSGWIFTPENEILKGQVYN
jgi:hypothetical protein